MIRETITRARNLAASRQECVRFFINAQTANIETHKPDVNYLCTSPLGAVTTTVQQSAFPSNINVGTFSNGTQEFVFNTQGGLANLQLVTFAMNDTTSNATGTFTIYPAIGQIRSK